MTDGIDARLDDPRIRTVLLLVGIAGVSSAAVLVRVADAPALVLAWWRTAAAAALLAPAARRSRVLPDVRQLRLLVVSGTLLAAHFTLWFVSLELTTVATSAVLVAMSPLAVAIGSGVLLGEPPARATWAGLAAAVAGSAVIAVADTGPTSGGRPLLGASLALAAAVAGAGYLLAGRLARRALPVSVYAVWTYGGAAVVLTVGSLLTGSSLGLTGGYDATTWAAIAGLVVGPQLLGHTVFNLVLGRLSATAVAVAVVAEPVGAAALAAVVLSEVPPLGFYAGAPFVLAGVLVAAIAPVTSGRTRRAVRGTRAAPGPGPSAPTRRDRPTRRRRRRRQPSVSRRPRRLRRSRPSSRG